MSETGGGSDNETVRCANCGTRNPRDVAQCLYCGEALRVTEPAPIEQRRFPLLPRLLVSLAVGALILCISVSAGFSMYQGSAITSPQERTLKDIGVVRDQVEAYRRERRVLPDTLRNLPLVEGGYVRSNQAGIPMDWWGRPLEYWRDGTHYRIISYGYDGKRGGVGLYYDLSTEDIQGTDTKRSWPKAPRQARATFWQFATDRGLVYSRRGGLHGSGGMMLLTCVLTGLLAFALSFQSLGAPLPAHRGAWALLGRLVLITAGTFFVGVMYIMSLHIPSGH